MADDKERGVWLESQPDDQGVYHLVLELDDDDVIPLDTSAALGWAHEVLAAVAVAEYDAAVLRQLMSIDVPADAAAQVVQLLRRDRGVQTSTAAIPGLAVVPGVSAFTGNAFLRLERKGRSLGQWEMQDARDHALHLITAVEVAVLDAAYLHALATAIGIDRTRAMAVVADLFKHRVP